MISGFTQLSVEIDGNRVFYQTAGDGAPVLMLHGFPQNSDMWMQAAPILSADYQIICPDLRGYGQSGKPTGIDAYSFRAMAAELVGLMDHLGHDHFHVIGHDRGARTGHRMALDHPARLLSLCLMDIIPTHTLLRDLRAEVADAYYHWFFLAQNPPMPETLIGAATDTYYESCLGGWGGAGLGQFDAAQLASYRASWQDPAVIEGMCNDYRAALKIDVEHDAADLDARVTCPTMILYGANGKMAQFFDVPKTWADKCENMQSAAIAGGHFFIDTNPKDTTAALQGWLRQQNPN
jgi:haloacetate dehalogenase